MADAYQTLGIAPGATVEEIKSAYRALARQWHPDRFPEGPERIQAEGKMIKLNHAYEEALKHSMTLRPPQSATAPGATAGREQEELLSDIRSLMALGQLENARRALMRAEGRGAEWNYLFGAILMRMGDYDRASVYFGVSTRMSPDSAQYRAALRSAESLRDRCRKTTWQQCVANIINSLRKNRPAARTFAAK